MQDFDHKIPRVLPHKFQGATPDPRGGSGRPLPQRPPYPPVFSNPQYFRRLAATDMIVSYTYSGDGWKGHRLYAGLASVDVVEEILMKTRVLRVIRSDLLLAFQIDADLKSYCSRHRRTICPLLCQ